MRHIRNILTISNIKSFSLGFYSFKVFIGFNIFIVTKEEPRLKKDFGVDYDNYCKKVRRWF